MWAGADSESSKAFNSFIVLIDQIVASYSFSVIEVKDSQGQQLLYIWNPWGKVETKDFYYKNKVQMGCFKTKQKQQQRLEHIIKIYFESDSLCSVKSLDNHNFPHQGRFRTSNIHRDKIYYISPEMQDAIESPEIQSFLTSLNKQNAYLKKWINYATCKVKGKEMGSVIA